MRHAASETSHTSSTERVHPPRTHALQELFPLGLELGQSDESDALTLFQTTHDLCAVPVGQADHYHTRFDGSILPDHEHHSLLGPCRSRRATSLELTPIEITPAATASLPLTTACGSLLAGVMITLGSRPGTTTAPTTG